MSGQATVVHLLRSVPRDGQELWESQAVTPGQTLKFVAERLTELQCEGVYRAFMSDGSIRHITVHSLQKWEYIL